MCGIGLRWQLFSQGRAGGMKMPTAPWDAHILAHESLKCP